MVRIAKKMDKMVHKKNAVSAAGGADRQAGWRAGPAGNGRGGPPAGPGGLPGRSRLVSLCGKLARTAPASSGGRPWGGGAAPRPLALGPLLGPWKFLVVSAA